MARNPGTRLYGVAIKLLAATGLLFLLITFTPFVSWYASQLARPWSTDEGDVLVVLSAAAPNSAVMDISTYWRCFMALVYYRQHPYRQVIVSGKDSAPGMRDFFILNGVPSDRIRVEDQSTNTHENAEFTARLLAGNPGHVVLITSDFHIFRARRCFAKAGIAVTTPAVPDAIKRSADFAARPELFVTELRETASIAWYWYRGWI
jgi:uncharacterized SAM-binding protein YcdF (DUF218 family)